MTTQHRKIDPMGVMGKIFARVGVGLIVIGVLIAVLLGRVASGGFVFSLLTLAGAWGTGLLFLLLGLTFLLLFRNSESANVVEHYLTALVNQDYTSAFQYLDTGLKTHQDGLEAQAWFTRRAQDAYGPLTDYALRSFRLQGKSATYTINITRGAETSTVPLFLVKRGGTWKISGLALY
jgi:hypothetical protein